MIQFSEMRVGNGTDSELPLCLEPEGDVVNIPAGQTCRILAVKPSGSVPDCEVVLGKDGALTIFLSLTKEIHIGEKRVR